MISNIIDKNLHYGMADFFFCDSFTDTYDYVFYMDHNGLILVARYSIDGSQARYAVSNLPYNTVFTGSGVLGSLVFVLPNELKDLRIQISQ